MKKFTLFKIQHQLAIPNMLVLFMALFVFGGCAQEGEKEKSNEMEAKAVFASNDNVDYEKYSSCQIEINYPEHVRKNEPFELSLKNTVGFTPKTDDFFWIFMSGGTGRGKFDSGGVFNTTRNPKFTITENGNVKIGLRLFVDDKSTNNDCGNNQIFKVVEISTLN